MGVIFTYLNELNENFNRYFYEGNKNLQMWRFINDFRETLHTTEKLYLNIQTLMNNFKLDDFV